jgi:hypothetical protein
MIVAEVLAVWCVTSISAGIGFGVMIKRALRSGA